MSVRLTIISLMQQIAAEQNRKLPELTDDLVLHESGFDSLCFAILVARLEDELGADPFSASDDAVFPVTLGDFIEVWRATKPDSPVLAAAIEASAAGLDVALVDERPTLGGQIFKQPGPLLSSPLWLASWVSCLLSLGVNAPTVWRTRTPKPKLGSQLEWSSLPPVSSALFLFAGRPIP